MSLALFFVVGFVHGAYIAWLITSHNGLKRQRQIIDAWQYWQDERSWLLEEACREAKEERVASEGSA